MVDALQIGVLVVYDLMIYVTYPVHLRLFYVLVTKRSAELDPAYQVLLINMTLFHILFSTSYSFIQEPAAHGLAPEFYAGTAQVLGRIELIKATVLVFAQVFSLMIALNRLTAFAVPMRQASIWTARGARILCGSVWVAFIAGAIPLCIMPSTSYRFKINYFGVNSVEFFLLGFFDKYYPLGGLIYLGVCEFTKIFVYIAILLLLKRYKLIRESQQMRSDIGGNYKTISKGIYRMTWAAAASSIGGWSIFAFFTAWYVCQWTTGTRLVSFTYYSLILRITSSLNHTITPWVMLFTFKSLRQIFLGRRAVKAFTGGSSSALTKTLP